MLRLEIQSDMCAELRTVAASNNRDHSIVACSRHIHNGVILHTHPVRGEPHNQRNTTGEVATVTFRLQFGAPKVLHPGQMSPLAPPSLRHCIPPLRTPMVMVIITLKTL